MRLFAAQDGAGMVEMGVDYLALMAFFYILPGLTNGIQGYFRGMGEMRTTLAATFIQISVRALAVGLLVPRVGLLGACLLYTSTIEATARSALNRSTFDTGHHPASCFCRAKARLPPCKTS